MRNGPGEIATTIVRGLAAATAAGLSGLAATGVATGLSAAHLSMLDTMKALVETLVSAEQSRPCHCGDVDSNTARIAYLEVQLASMQAEASGMAARTGTAAATLFSLSSGGAPGNGAGSSGDGLPPFVRTAAGGNGSCHCRCVEQLTVRVRALEQIPRTAAQREPFLPSMRTAPDSPPGMQPQGLETHDINGPMKLTLPLGQLGNERRDKSIYDDKMMTQPEYRFDGTKDGAKWKSKVERYFITKVPVAMEILKWAEAHNLDKITESKFMTAAHPHLSDEQCQTFNREIWGFLSGCLSGQAETHFKRADMLNGLDAWRRVVRIIEDTLPMRFEQLRRAAQMVHMKVIKDL